MTNRQHDVDGPFGPVSRRSAIGSMLAGAAFLSPDTLGASQTAAGSQGPPARRQPYEMKKSINLWAFPYPQKMTLVECLQLAKAAGFDGIELNYDLESDLSPRAGTREFQEIRRTADRLGIAISGLCSFLFWPYPLTSNDEAKRARGLELAGRMAQAAHDLGTENLLVVPGAVHIPWRDDHEPVPNDVCDRRAREAVGTLVKTAEKLKVHLNIENIFFNGYLMSPMEIERLCRQLRQSVRARPLRHGQHHAVSAPGTLDLDPGPPDRATRTSRSSARKARTIRSSRSGRCSTARPTGRR